MKRLWLVLLSLGLIVAFSTSAMAVDLKFSGEYYAAGMYLDKTNVNKNAFGTQATGLSTAFYYQRMRLNTMFIVHPGLFLITRADIMERAWGATRSTPNATTDMASSGTTAENENIAFDLVYAQYISPVGLFRVGYQDDGAWGTVFGDSTVPLAKAYYLFMSGPIAAGAYLAKFAERSNTFKAAATAADRDFDMYCAFVNYTSKKASAGFLVKHYRSALVRGALTVIGTTPVGAKTQFTALVPYVKAKLGPVAIQSELTYVFGDYIKWEDNAFGLQDVKLANWNAWIDALADFGIAYVGATVAYVSGDDPGTTDKNEGGVVTGGTDWNPCLIMFNFDRYYWAGKMNGYGVGNPQQGTNYFATNEGGMSNAWFFGLRGGVRPVEKLDIMLSVAYANADKKPAGVLNNSYGYEVDVTGTYKITNNLSYMIGAGYLFTGDFFKGATTANNDLQNNYLVINKLTLTF